MKPLFVIVSTIYFPEQPLSYIKTRSIFSPEQRIDQTLETIQSIRKKVPNAQIVLVESGNRYVSQFEGCVDYYIFSGNNFFVRHAVKSKYKGLGEVVILLSLRKLLANIDCDYIFKISGRYFLNEDFSLEYLFTDKFCFLKSDDKKSISTRLYWFPKKLLRAYIKRLFVSIPILFFGKNVESCFLFLFPTQKIYFLKRLGVSGYIAPVGNFISE
jgi:hypothetical protein